jgi:hypothetical protein
MIAKTATAKPRPWRIVSPPSASLTAVTSGGASAPRRRKNQGTTSSDMSGATAMPSATADCPDATPTTTASAKQTREIASRNTSRP